MKKVIVFNRKKIEIISIPFSKHTIDIAVEKKAERASVFSPPCEIKTISVEILAYHISDSIYYFAFCSHNDEKFFKKLKSSCELIYADEKHNDFFLLKPVDDDFEYVSLINDITFKSYEVGMCGMKIISFYAMCDELLNLKRM